VNAPIATRCHCGIPKGDTFAHQPWPGEDSYRLERGEERVNREVERCSACNAVLSYRWEVDPGVFERRTIARVATAEALHVQRSATCS
jgi:hypothetical protein